MGDWWSVAWRLHDAQFWGVPQRRKRIALVADFGGKSAPEILFERESMPGNIEQSKQERKETTRYTRESTYQSAYTLKIRGGAEIDSYGKKAGKGALVQTEKSGTLGVSQDQTLITFGDCYSVDEKMGQTYIHENQGNTLSARDYKQPQAVVYATQASGDRDNPSQSFQEEKAYTIPSNSMSDRGQAIVYGLCSDGSNSMRSPNPYSGCYEADSSRTLDNNGGNPACNQGGMIIVDKEPMCIQRRFSSVNVSENGISPTLEAGAGEGGNNMPIVLEGNGTRESHKGPGYKESDVMYSLNTVELHAVCTYQDKTGTLSPGAHAGSYNGQDAYNDMLVIGGGTEPTTASKASFFLNARSDGKADTLVATDYKDPQLIAYGVDCYNQSVTGDKSKALNNAATDSDHIPCIAIDRASFNQGKNAQYDFSVQEDIAQPLVARGPGGGTDTVGALCARDYKGVGNQYVSEGKVIVQSNRKSSQ